MRYQERLPEEEARRWAADMKEAIQAGETRDYPSAHELVEARKVFFRDNVFEGASPYYSEKHEKELATLKGKVENAAPWLDDRFSLLAFSKGLSYEGASPSGHALPFHGVLKIKTDLLRVGMDKFAEAVALHERVHLQIGGELRREVFKAHPDADRFFHEFVLPEWTRGKIKLPEPDKKFLDFKYWRSLYDNWMGPLEVKKEDAVLALNRYFWLLERGLISVNEEGEVAHILNPDSDALRPSEKERKPVNMEELYNSNPDKFLKILVTGYALGNYLQDAYLHAEEARSRKALWEIEEGVANHIGTDLAGIELDDLQRVAPQDLGKISLAKKIRQNPKNISTGLLNKILGYPELADFAKNLEIGISGEEGAPMQEKDEELSKSIKAADERVREMERQERIAVIRRQEILKVLKRAGLPDDVIKAFENIHTDTFGHEIADLEKYEIALTLRDRLEKEGIVAKEKLLYIGSGTDIEYPLTLGCRKLILVEPRFKGKGVLDELVERARVFDPKARLIRQKGQNKLQFLFDFTGKGKEEVTVEIVPKFLSEYLPEEKLGGVLAYQSHVEAIAYPEILQKIVRGGYILDNHTSPIEIAVRIELVEKFGEEGAYSYPPKDFDDMVEARVRQYGLEFLRPGKIHGAFYRKTGDNEALRELAKRLEESRQKTFESLQKVLGSNL